MSHFRRCERGSPDFGPSHPDASDLGSARLVVKLGTQMLAQFWTKQPSPDNWVKPAQESHLFATGRWASVLF